MKYLKIKSEETFYVFELGLRNGTAEPSLCFRVETGYKEMRKRKNRICTCDSS
jgi:hypothetical protein